MSRRIRQFVSLGNGEKESYVNSTLVSIWAGVCD
jgi:hypothetical protein